MSSLFVWSAFRVKAGPLPSLAAVAGLADLIGGCGGGEVDLVRPNPKTLNKKYTQILQEHGTIAITTHHTATITAELWVM